MFPQILIKWTHLINYTYPLGMVELFENLNRKRNQFPHAYQEFQLKEIPEPPQARMQIKELQLLNCILFT